MKKLIALLLITTQTAWAAPGLPPTSLQGQADAAPKTKFFFQAPNSSATDLGGVKGLIETGNKNLLANASFEDNGPSGYSHFWTITKTSGTTFTGAVDTSNYEDGKQSAQLTLTSAVGCITQDVTPNQAGGNHENSIWVKTSLTDVQVCSRTGGTTSTSNCQTLTGTNAWVQVVLNQPGPSSGSEGISVCNQNSESGTFNVDDAYVGVARNVQSGAQQMTNWTAATFTSLAWQGLGTVTNNLQVRRIGDSMQIRGKFTTGTTTALQAQIPLPSNFGTVSSSAGIQANEVSLGGIFRNIGSTGQFVTAILQPSVSYINVSGATISASNNPATPVGGSTAFGNSEVEDLQVTVPITQFGALSLLNTTDQSDFGWTNDNSIVSPGGFGTVSSVYYSKKRIGDTLWVRGYFTEGTGSGTLTLGLSGCTIDSTKFGTQTQIQKVGEFHALPNTTNGGSVYATSYATSAIFYDGSDTANLYIAGATAGVTNYTFNKSVWASYTNLLANGWASQFEFSVPCSQWANTNRAPNLIGSVTSNDSAKSYHTEVADVACTGAGCTINSQSGSWLTSVSHPGVGTYKMNISAVEFSATPYCFFTQNQFDINAVASMGGGQCTWSSTCVPVVFRNVSTGTTEDGNFVVTCTGPR